MILGWIILGMLIGILGAGWSLVAGGTLLSALAIYSLAGTTTVVVAVIASGLRNDDAPLADIEPAGSA